MPEPRRLCGRGDREASEPQSKTRWFPTDLQKTDAVIGLTDWPVSDAGNAENESAGFSESCRGCHAADGLFAFPVEQEIHPLTKANCRYDY